MHQEQINRIVDKVIADGKKRVAEGKQCGFTNGYRLDAPCHCEYCVNRFGPKGRPSLPRYKAGR